MALPKTLAKSDKFAWSKFEQPIGWPGGRKPWMVFVKAQEIGGISGGLFFEYFLLATQKKVSRLSGRDPTSQSLAIAIPMSRQQSGPLLADLHSR